MAIFIAEFCQNHNGDLEVLRDMVWAAAEAGADFAKIQTIHVEDLSHRPRFDEGETLEGVTTVIKRPYSTEYQRLAGLEVPHAAYEDFADECARAGIRPLTTVFSRRRVDAVASLGWSAVKVASYDCASYPLLRDLKSSFPTLFVSTGATFDDEVRQAARILAGSDFHFLHCVTIYPTPLDQLHLRRMKWLRQFTPKVGFSDHTHVARDGIIASVAALHEGADVIERHFTILPPEATRDGPVSINQAQLRELVDLGREGGDATGGWLDDHKISIGHLLGMEQRDMSPAELLNREYYRGRFASKRSDGRWVYNWEDDEVA